MVEKKKKKQKNDAHGAVWPGPAGGAVTGGGWPWSRSCNCLVVVVVGCNRVAIGLRR